MGALKDGERHHKMEFWKNMSHQVSPKRGVRVWSLVNAVIKAKGGQDGTQISSSTNYSPQNRHTISTKTNHNKDGFIVELLN